MRKLNALSREKERHIRQLWAPPHPQRTRKTNWLPWHETSQAQWQNEAFERRQKQTAAPWTHPEIWHHPDGVKSQEEKQWWLSKHRQLPHRCPKPEQIGPRDRKQALQVLIWIWKLWLRSIFSASPRCEEQSQNYFEQQLARHHWSRPRWLYYQRWY